MNVITLRNRTKITTKLSVAECIKRYNRLDTLRVICEGHEEGEGLNIFEKAYKAESKNNNFTGIIRLTRSEKDFLGYKFEGSFISEEDKKVLNFYLK